MVRSSGNMPLFFLVLFFSVAVLAAQKSNPNGYNRFFHENGKVSSEGNLRNGKPDGYWRNYFPSGKLKIEGNRKNFLLDSTWKFYSEKGYLTKSIEYNEGQKHGPTITYDSLGRIRAIESFSNDVKEGYSKTFYPTGTANTITM